MVIAGLKRIYCSCRKVTSQARQIRLIRILVTRLKEHKQYITAQLITEVTSIRRLRIKP